MQRCSRCGRPVQFLPTAEGKRKMVDAEELWMIRDNENGRHTALDINGRAVRGDYGFFGEDGGMRVWKEHRLTCPKAGEPREARRKPREPERPRAMAEPQIVIDRYEDHTSVQIRLW